MTMKMERFILVLTVALVMAAMMVATAAPALAAPPECPPGQTGTVDVLGTEAVETCRVL